MKKISEINWIGTKINLLEDNHEMIGKSGLEDYQIRRLVENGFYDDPCWLFYTYFLEEDLVHINVTKYNNGICVWLSAMRESEIDKDDLTFGYIMKDEEFMKFFWNNKFVEKQTQIYDLSDIAKSYFNGEEISEDNLELLKRRLCFSW